MARRKKSGLQTNLEFLATAAVVRTIGAFPLRYSMKIGEKIAVFLSKFFPKLRRVANRNFDIALPETSAAEREKLLRGTFESLGRQLGLVAHFDKFKHEDVQNLVEIVGREHFEKSYATGRGMLFFTGHFGSWEVFNLLSPAFGYPFNVVVRRIDNPKIEAFVERLRTRFDTQTIDKTVSARKMFRLLGDGALLGIMGDLNVQEREGVFVNFFGVPASTASSIAKLALATNAVVMPAFAVWNEEKQRYIVHLEPPIEYEKTGDNQADILNITQKMTDAIEVYIRRFPAQWMWIHKRWNTRPKGEKGLY